MGLFNQFPFTNFHELNLDWIINTITEIKSEIGNIPKEIDEYLKSEAFQIKLQTWVNEYLMKSGSPVPLKLFGAKGDGTTDDSAAFEIAYKLATKMVNFNTSNAWQNHTNGALYLGSGRFKITSDNPLAIKRTDSTTGGSVWGVRIYGDGPFASQLFYSPESSKSELHYFYKQTELYAGMIGASFENIGLLIDENTDGNFFYINSVANNTTQGWYFTNCNLIGNRTATVLKTNGEYNDSEFTFTNCRIREVATVVDTSEGSYENLHYIFNSTHLEHIFSDCFKTGGGSGIFVNDCSLLFSDNSENEAAIINIVNRCVTGGEYSFTNVRAEFHGNSIIYKESAYNQAVVSFRNCRLGTSYALNSKIKIPMQTGTMLSIYDSVLCGVGFQETTETPFIDIYDDTTYSGIRGAVMITNCMYYVGMPITSFPQTTKFGIPIIINNLIKTNEGILPNQIISTAGNRYVEMSSLQILGSTIVHKITNKACYYIIALFGSNLPDTIELTSDNVKLTAINSDTTCRFYKPSNYPNEYNPITFNRSSSTITSGYALFSSTARTQTI